MTLGRLNQHLELVEKYIETREIAQRLRDSLGLKAQNISGMPHGSGVGDVVGNTVVELVRIEDMLKELEAKVIETQKPIEDWIGSVDDIYVQTILRLRFLHGLKWSEVANAIGGGNTVQSVRTAVYRLF